MSDDDEISESDYNRVLSASGVDPQTSYNLACNKIFLEGTKQFDDFEDAIGRLKGAEVSTPDVLLQVMETDQPHKVLYELAADLDLAKQVAALPPVKRAAALSAIERGEPIPASRTPAWKTPVSRRHEDQLDDESWAKANRAGKLPRMRDR